MNTMELIINSHHGQYAPQYFAELLHDSLKGVKKEDLDILMAGPEEEWYWEAWLNVEQNGYITHEGADWTIHQFEGDIWLVHPSHEFEEEFF